MGSSDGHCTSAGGAGREKAVAADGGLGGRLVTQVEKDGGSKAAALRIPQAYLFRTNSYTADLMTFLCFSCYASDDHGENKLTRLPANGPRGKKVFGMRPDVPEGLQTIPE
jgi:hypothetical protein